MYPEDISNSAEAYGDETASRAQLFEWYKRFSEREGSVWMRMILLGAQVQRLQTKTLPKFVICVGTHSHQWSELINTTTLR
ncbi:hypothetical protein TNCV_1490001 [Trichonephila clavipes]|nr:hypothetical protein TNCV_1490001 [Trichonephila clavipes]